MGILELNKKVSPLKEKLEERDQKKTNASIKKASLQTEKQLADKQEYNEAKMKEKEKSRK